MAAITLFGLFLHASLRLPASCLQVDSIKDTVSTVKAMTAASKEMKSNFKKNKELDINYIDKMNGGRRAGG